MVRICSNNNLSSLFTRASSCSELSLYLFALYQLKKTSWKRGRKNYVIVFFKNSLKPCAGRHISPLSFIDAKVVRSIKDGTYNINGGIVYYPGGFKLLNLLLTLWNLAFAKTANKKSPIFSESDAMCRRSVVNELYTSFQHIIEAPKTINAAYRWMATRRCDVFRYKRLYLLTGISGTLTLRQSPVKNDMYIDYGHSVYMLIVIDSEKSPRA